MDNNNLKYVCSYHEVTEKELQSERLNITNFQNESDKDRINIIFRNIYYPVFQYERVKIARENSQKETKNLPYGECFTTAFNREASLLACGYSNGHVNIFNLKEKKEPIKFQVSDYPVTSIKWNEKSKGVLLIGAGDGKVSHWNATNGTMLHSIQEQKNSINSVDYSFDYQNFITAGNDVTVRLYDYNTKTQISFMRPLKFDEPGHCGRIFCVKYVPNDTSTLYSGGWDKTIQFYDVRTAKIANSIFGPEICGDSLDMYGNVVASGAWSTKEQIQLWDIRTLKCLCNVEWENKSCYRPTYIYSVKFNKRRDNLCLAVSGVNNALFRIFNMSTFSADKGMNDDNKPKISCGSGENYNSCFTTDFVKNSKNSDLLCCGCGDGGSRVYSLEYGSS